MPTDLLAASTFILVDHHNNAKVRDRIIEVIDHRPFDAASALPAAARQTIREVGSCCTLIADRILSATDAANENFDDILRLLYPVIVLDTVNFSEVADKARELDVSVANRIEQKGLMRSADRQKIFNELVAARADVSQLTAYEMLWKDLKLVTGSMAGGRTIGIPGFPMSVQV